MPDLLIKQVDPGVFLITSSDPFSHLEIYRIDRSVWQRSPNVPGVYLLYGIVNDRAAAYVGMSTTSIQSRIKSHVKGKKDWFGTIFAVPVQSSVLCPAIEAEMIRKIDEAGVVTVTNITTEARHLDDDDVHVAPALTAITQALEILLGSDIFSPQAEDDVANSSVVLPDRTPLLARVYKGGAALPRQRNPEDVPEATHAYVGSGTKAWGRFNGPEPEVEFEVLAGSHFRRPFLDNTQAAYGHQRLVETWQQELALEEVIDLSSLVFLKNHVFENWTRASKVVSGKGTYAGAYHWQRLE